MRLVYVTLAWCAGILLAASTQVTNCPFWIVVSLFAATAALFAWRRRERRALHILLLLLALGGLRYALVPASSLLAAYNGSGGLTVEGIIDSEPQPRNDRKRGKRMPRVAWCWLIRLQRRTSPMEIACA
jgi:hypothetical protein